MSDVADLAYERVKRRGEGWASLESELTEVPPIADEASVASEAGEDAERPCAPQPSTEQLALFGTSWRDR